MSIELLIFIAIAVGVYWISSGNSSSMGATEKLLGWVSKYVFFFDAPLRNRWKESERKSLDDNLTPSEQKKYKYQASISKSLLAGIYMGLALAFLVFLLWGRIMRILRGPVSPY
jgi:hypothetical protein